LYNIYRLYNIYTGSTNRVTEGGGVTEGV